MLLYSYGNRDETFATVIPFMRNVKLFPHGIFSVYDTFLHHFICVEFQNHIICTSGSMSYYALCLSVLPYIAICAICDQTLVKSHLISEYIISQVFIIMC